MLNIIKQWVRDFGVVAVLRGKSVESNINAYQVDFLDKDDKYHSCVILYDSVRIYGYSKGMIGENNNDIMPYLGPYHKIFNTKEDWLAGRFADISAKAIRNFCAEMEPIVKNREYGEYRLINIRYGYDPVVIIVEFSYNRTRQRNLILVPGQITDCTGLYPTAVNEFSNFLRLIGVSEYVNFKFNMEMF